MTLIEASRQPREWSPDNTFRLTDNAEYFAGILSRVAVVSRESPRTGLPVFYGEEGMLSEGVFSSDVNLQAMRLRSSLFLRYRMLDSAPVTDREGAIEEAKFRAVKLGLIRIVGNMTVSASTVETYSTWCEQLNLVLTEPESTLSVFRRKELLERGGTRDLGQELFYAGTRLEAHRRREAQAVFRVLAPELLESSEPKRKKFEDLTEITTSTRFLRRFKVASKVKDPKDLLPAVEAYLEEQEKEENPKFGMNPEALIDTATLGLRGYFRSLIELENIQVPTLLRFIPESDTVIADVAKTANILSQLMIKQGALVDEKGNLVPSRSFTASPTELHRAFAGVREGVTRYVLKGDEPEQLKRYGDVLERFLRLAF